MVFSSFFKQAATTYYRSALTHISVSVCTRSRVRHCAAKTTPGSITLQPTRLNTSPGANSFPQRTKERPNKTP